jgi:hypothetical protein
MRNFKSHYSAPPSVHVLIFKFAERILVNLKFWGISTERSNKSRKMITVFLGYDEVWCGRFLPQFLRNQLPSSM